MRVKEEILGRLNERCKRLRGKIVGLFIKHARVEKKYGVALAWEVSRSVERYRVNLRARQLSGSTRA